MKYDADTIVRQQAVMESERSTFDAHWQDVAELLFPRMAYFVGGNATPGAKNTSRQFDETAMLALQHFVAVVEGYLMPRGSIYQHLRPEDDELLKIKRVREWYEAKTRLLMKRRYAGKSGFINQMHESVASLGAFGNQALWADPLRGPDGRPTGIYYRSVFIGECYIAENFQGMIDRINRKFTRTARQAVQQWRDNAPECAKRAVRDNKPEERHEYVQALFPRADADPGRIDARGMPIGSMTIALHDKETVEETGFRRMPLIYSRYETSPLEVNGRGPGMHVLPAVKACQAMMQSLVRGVQLAAEPPLGAPHEDVCGTIEYKPRGVTYGAVDEGGNRLVQPLFDGADTQSAERMLTATRGVIDQAFLKHLFAINQDLKSHVGQDQILERAGEKGMLLAPLLGRQEPELLDPLTEREVDIMFDLGDFDDMPPEVVEAGGAFAVRYDNLLARSQRAQEGAGFFATLNGLSTVAQVKPEVLDIFDFEEAARDLALDINGVPAKWVKDPKRMAAERSQQQQQQGVEKLLEAAPVVTGAASDLAAIQQAAAQ